jgi:hypothetical protein
MTKTIEYVTVLACYLPPEWANAYYGEMECETLYDKWDLHYFPVEGLTHKTVRDLQERELESYAHRIIWEPSSEALLLSCIGEGLAEAFVVESDTHALRQALSKTLHRKVMVRLRSGLLQELKTKDDTEWVREQVRHRAERQLAGDFSPYGSGESVLDYTATTCTPDFLLGLFNDSTSVAQDADGASSETTSRW